MVSSCTDEVKVAVVDAGCVEQLVRIVDPSLQMKAIDLLVLICANCEYACIHAHQLEHFSKSLLCMHVQTLA